METARRPPSAHRQSALDVRTLLWCGLAVLMACAPLLRELPLWLAAMSVSAVLLRPAIALRPVNGVALRWSMALAALAGTAAVYGQFHTLLGREAGTALLVLMVAFKLLESRTPRDAYVVIL